MMDDAPTPGEIDAYVDGVLDTGRKFVVETYLSNHPELAARVMGDLGSASGLKLLFATGDVVEANAVQVVSPVKAGAVPSFWHRHRGPIAGLSVAGAAAAAGLFFVDVGAPNYVDYAVSSHRIALLRANMRSQVETPLYDAKEIASSTQIAIPTLPASWNITDVQLFPTDKGPALVVALKTETGKQLSLFALRERTNAPERPDAIREGTQSVAYWRRGDMSYALTGDGEASTIDATAEALAGTWS